MYLEDVLREFGKSWSGFESWVWQLAHQKALPVLRSVFSRLLQVLAPADKVFGTASSQVSLAVAHTLVALTIAELMVCKANRASRAKVLHMCSPILHESICQGSATAFWYARGVCNGSHALGESATYALWVPGSIYVGKANLVRLHGPGIPGRLVEHLRLTARPALAGADKARYRLFRQHGLQAMRFLPTTVWKDEQSALAAESVLIRCLAPVANKAEMPSGPRQRRRVVRGRPPKHLRQATGSCATIWDSSISLNAMCKPLRVSLGACELRVPFNMMYRELQRERLVLQLGVGPISIFEYVQLWLSWVASPHGRRFSWFPKWPVDQVDGFLDEAAQWVDRSVVPAGARARVRQHIDRLFSRFHLPPFRPRPIVVSGLAKRPCRKVAMQALNAAISSAPVAAQRRVRRVPPMVTYRPRWADSVSSAPVCRAWSNVEVEGWSHGDLACAAMMPSLRAVSASWRLPRWLTNEAVGSCLERSCAKWGLALTLPQRAFWRALHTVARGAAALHLPPQPALWALEEQRMGLASSSGLAVVGDDRDHGKAWTVQPNELCLALLLAVLMDPNWAIRKDLTGHDVLIYLVAQAMAVFPAWLRGAMGTKLRAPYVFVLIKSKCFSDSGSKCCNKVNHSCMRRVFDMWGGSFSPCMAICCEGSKGGCQRCIHGL